MANEWRRGPWRDDGSVPLRDAEGLSARAEGQRNDKDVSEAELALYCLRAFFLGGGLFRAAPEACGGSQARGPIGAVATSLCQSQSNARSELRLQPTPQLTAMPDP